MTRTNTLRAALAAAPLALLAFAPAANAQTTLTLFNFNSTTPDGNTATGSTAPSAGSQAASLALLGTTSTFASGAGSSDTTAADNSGLNTTGYPTQSTGNLTEGVRFNVSTVGFQNVVFTFDLRHSNTASRFVGINFTTDGTTFQRYTGPTTTTGTPGAGGTRTDGLFEAFNGGDLFYNGRTVDFSATAGVNNNANFAVQVVTAFAPGTNAYAASTTTSTYATTGTLRFDQVTFTGTAITGTPGVNAPEPASVALLGMGLIGGIAARRRRK